MTSIHDFVGGDYLKAADIAGQTPTVQIKEFRVEEIGDEKERRCVAVFHELKKGLVIACKANALVLLELFQTDQIERWTQHVQSTPTFVQLYTEATNLGPGLRIRPVDGPPEVTPTAAAATPQQPPVDPALVAAVIAQLQRGPQ
jgi:hypothetical protein